jgi:hypothetical protein
MKSLFDFSSGFSDFSEFFRAPAQGTTVVGGTPDPGPATGSPIVVSDEVLETEGNFAASGSGGPGSVVSVSGAASAGLTINLIFDAAAMAAPQSFRDGITQAMQMICAVVTDKITINLQIDYSGTGGSAAAGPTGGYYEPYSTVRADLVNNASPGDTTLNALPTGNSIAGQTQVAVWYSQAKLWGIVSPTGSEVDGSATFSTDINPNLLVGVALHELTHAMGRVPYGPSASQPSVTQPDIFDFYRFTSSGNILIDGDPTAPAAYFSLNGGTTKIADYGQTSDASDFLNSGVQGSTDPFNEFYSNNTQQQLTAIDLMQLDALGFHLAINAPVDTPVVSDLNGASISAHRGQVYQLSSLFSASDPLNQPLVYYVDDLATGANAGHFSIAGVAQTNGHWITVTQTQLSQTTYTAGQGGASDPLVMIADNGSAQGHNSVTVNALANHAPVVTDVHGTTVTAHGGQVIQLSSLFSASDPDGDSLSYYVYDASTGANNGHFSIAGVAQTNGHWITVSQAQLAQTSFVAGQNGASDTLLMLADDGSLQGYNSLTVSASAVNHAPVVNDPSGSAISTTRGNAIQLSSLFSASDPDGDSLSYYVYDASTGPNNGHFSIAGVAQTNGHWITVTQAQLSQTTFVAGQSGASDTLLMIADDGSLQGHNSVQVSVGSGTGPAPGQPDVHALSAGGTFGSFRDLPQGSTALGGGPMPLEPPVHVGQTEAGFNFSPAALPTMDSSELLPDHNSLHLAGQHDFLIS